MSAKTIFIISDGTGETASIMARAALVQYMNKEIEIVRCKNVRRPSQVESLVSEAQEKAGMIIYTVVSPTLREKIRDVSLEKGVQAVDLLGPLLESLDGFFGNNAITPKAAGLLRDVNERYFNRIEAMEFTVKHDDGRELRDLKQADIVLLGVSRTSKTPLSIFLSAKGWKVANVPIVLGVDIPKELEEVDTRRIVCLTINPEKLASIRSKRLEKLGGSSSGEYASLGKISEEVEYALGIYRKNRRWPVFDVTERALEETASEIIKLVSNRLGIKSEFLL